MIANIIVDGQPFQPQNAGKAWSLTQPAANVQRFEARPGDVWTPPDAGLSKWRSELMQIARMPIGKLVVIDYAVTYPPGPSVNSDFCVTGQLQQDGNASLGSPPISIEIGAPDWAAQQPECMMVVMCAPDPATGRTLRHTLAQAPLVRGRAYHMHLEARLDPTGLAGSLVVVRDGAVIVNYQGAIGGPGMTDTYWKFGVYMGARTNEGAPANGGLIAEYADMAIAAL